MEQVGGGGKKFRFWKRNRGGDHLRRSRGNAQRAGQQVACTAGENVGEIVTFSNASDAVRGAGKSFPALLDRCIDAAFGVLHFQRDMVRKQARSVQIGCHRFVVTERTITGANNAIYRRNQKLWEHVPRGDARVFAVSEGGSVFTCVCALRGLRKFGLFDDCYGSSVEIDGAFAFELIDGEGGHVSAFTYGNERYWLVGGNATYLVVRFDVSEEDIISNFSDDTVQGGVLGGEKGMMHHWTTSIPARITRLWGKTLQSLHKGSASSLHEFLASTGYTACFDAVLHECGHLVDYGPEEHLRFYALTERDQTSLEGLCVDPVVSVERLLFYGLPVVRFYSEQGSDKPAVLELGKNEYLEYRDHVAREVGSRGAVLYGVKRDGTVVRLWKLPSHAYGMERAAQESIVTHRLCGSILRDKLKKKLNRLPRKVRNYLREWSSIRLEFLLILAAWLHSIGKITPTVSLEDLQHVRRCWIRLQRDFSARATDGAFLEHLAQYEPSPVEEKVNDPSVIMCIGPQGCGKSTLSRALSALLKQAGQRPRWINQDEIGKQRQFIEAIRRAKESDCSHIIIDKMNLNEEARRCDYASLNLKAMYVGWSHPDGFEKMVDVCVERVHKRGDEHRTFKLSELKRKGKDIRQIIRSCAAQCFLPTSGIVVVLNVADSLEISLASVWQQLCKHSQMGLPELDSLDVKKALNAGSHHRTSLSKSPRRIIYASIVMTVPVGVKALVPADYMEGKKAVENLHITTMFLGGKPPEDVEMFSELEKLEGKTIDVTLVRVVSDAKATAIEVRNNNEFPCQNKHAHITVGLAPGVPAKYSNELLDDSLQHEGERNVLEIPPDTSLPGVFQFVR
uniref:tRNA ligase phosphodiesterase domain-containing protein n=1 Tax=Trypanosoma congolense (strain IL3000) TaxID=1068625 RepID=G0URJ4_TRYCI|nr:conserved hypothetical protein [Trypanosoma congolense IL3000]